MKFSRLMRRATIAIAAVTIGAGLFAVPSMAAESNTGASSQEQVTATRAGQVDWSNAFSQAQATYGTGDKAYLEAMKASSLLVTYCTTYDNIAPGNGYWYKIPSAGGTAGFSCVLEVGVSGNGVKALQENLNKCYGRSLTVDGVFGTATYNALMYAQGAAGIAVDGVYGSNTRKNIKWWGGGSVCTKGSSIGL